MVNKAGLAMTNGALSGIAELGLSVPNDISIIDYGSTSFISSINQKAAEIGQAASQALLDLIEGREVPCKFIIAPELVIRNSTRHINQPLEVIFAVFTKPVSLNNIINEIYYGLIEI